MPVILVPITAETYFNADKVAAILLVSLYSLQQSLGNRGSYAGGIITAGMTEGLIGK
jgi:hypothetical protein